MKIFLILVDLITKPHQVDTSNIFKKNLIKEPKCYNNSEKPALIDLIIINKPRNFQYSCAYETDLLDLQKMTSSFKNFHKDKTSVCLSKNVRESS